MNRAYLSRNDIEQIAKRVSAQYKSVAVPQKHLCYVVDPIELADVLGLQAEFQYLTRDGSVLGLTTPEEALIPVLDMRTKENPFGTPRFTVSAGMKNTLSVKAKRHSGVGRVL